MDKIISKRLLNYGINTKIIKPYHFGFIKGIGTIDVLSYVLDIIYSNKNDNIFTHMVLLDFHSAFDTVDMEIFFYIISNDLLIIGNSFNYLYKSLNNRKGRVKINGYF